ncbi:TIGR01777 family oxidoreductase [Aestuariispira insulae]|uniref:TIGR01777 family protein n=1 Tax=Aestuariispira insulae TaxID=1461337 RepID=A0A3D9HPW2_9PROT|nr:TIGR01777 family oxidoreductase [Aestuariispira insulae]RED51554.1 hypothetical protein DFP90_103357 [Aestuariispira insulae]
MELVLIMLTIQALMGAFDNLYHHEITERLPSKPEARGELALHTTREFLYALIFLMIGWTQPQGLWALFLIGLMAVEIVVTLWDFIIEDQTRKLPKFERVLHTVLAINFGAILAFLLPILWAWTQLPTALVPVNYGLFTPVMTVFAIGVFLWALRDLVAVIRLGGGGLPAWQRRPIKKGQQAKPRTVLVTGATGFIGNHLVRVLLEEGDDVIVLARDEKKAKSLFGPHAEVVSDLALIPDDRKIDAIVNLAGAPVIGLPWTKARRQALLESRLGVTAQVNELIQRLSEKPECLINGSAIGFYGNRGDEPLDEAGGSQDIFMAELCRRWEEAAKLARNFGVRVCCVRTGLVLGHDGGALPQLARPAAFGLGVIFGRGDHWQSWIHVADLVALIRYLVDHRDIKGAVNGTAPHPVRQRDFVKILGRVLVRPVWLRVPKTLIRLALGEMAEIFTEGQKVLPVKAQAHGFNFHYPMLEGALRALRHDKAKVKPNREPLTVYYNHACGICRREIGHYQKLAEAGKRPLECLDINSHPRALAAYGLGPNDIRRRLYVLDGDGHLFGGVDSFIRIWALIPRFHGLAVLAQMPLVNPLAGLIYERMMVPWLWARNQRLKRTECPVCHQE